jgi:hypothetical protein
VFAKLVCFLIDWQITEFIAGLPHASVVGLVETMVNRMKACVCKACMFPHRLADNGVYHRTPTCFSQCKGLVLLSITV